MEVDFFTRNMADCWKIMNGMELRTEDRSYWGGQVNQISTKSGGWFMNIPLFQSMLSKKGCPAETFSYVTKGAWKWLKSKKVIFESTECDGELTKL
jgi:hypothetical protein